MKYRKSLKRFRKSKTSKSKKSKKIYGGDITEARKQMIRNQYPVGSPTPTYDQYRNFLRSNISEFNSLLYPQLREYYTFLFQHLGVLTFTSVPPPPPPPPARAAFTIPAQDDPGYGAFMQDMSRSRGM